MKWARINLVALLTVCAAITVVCAVGGWFSAQADDWTSFAAFTACAAASGWMTGAVFSWLREDAQ